MSDLPSNVITKAAKLCFDRRAMLLLDAPLKFDISQQSNPFSETGISAQAARNVAVYFPRVKLSGSPLEDREYSPLGAIAGVYSRTDVERGVWKAPAGIDTSLAGVSELMVELSDEEQALLNPLAVNCLRTFPAAGNVIWGARTLCGIDHLADTTNKYINVRRLTLFIEESLYRGTRWVVFEPNDEPLWARIRLNVASFMVRLFRQGAFQGRTPTEAYFVKCDNETTTLSDVNNGILNILVGFAPLKPAEFVTITIQQFAE